MPTFPTLTALPTFPLSERREDSVIRTSFDAGYEQTRNKFPRIRKVWDISYINIDLTDKEAIDDFIDTVNGGADSFTWTNPADSASYTVRFLSPPSFQHTQYERWNCQFSVRQV